MLSALRPQASRPGPGALSGRSQPCAAFAAHPTARQRASGQWAGGGGGGDGRRTSRRQLRLAAGSSGSTDAGSNGSPDGSSGEDLVRASYPLTAEEQRWLESWRGLSAAPPAEPGALEAAVSPLLRAFAAFTPEQQWRAAWMRLDQAQRTQLLNKYAADSEAKLVHNAAADFEGWAQDKQAARMSVWLVLAAAGSRHSTEGAVAAAAAVLQVAQQLEAASDGSCSGSRSTATAGQTAGQELAAYLTAGIAALSVLALMWYGWRRAAATWVLPAVPWGGGTVVVVMAAFALAQTYISQLWRDVSKQVLQMLQMDGSTPQGGAWATVVVADQYALCVLVATAAILYWRVLSAYPQALSLGLFSARLWPLCAWLPCVAAYCALQGCLLLLVDKANAAARTAGIHEGVLKNADSLAPMAGALCNRRVWARWLLATTVTGPVYEELLFRGFLLPSLALWLPPWAAVALSSLVFALTHGNVAHLWRYWWGGCLFGWCYANTGNLLAPIVLHSAFNFLAAAELLWYQRQHSFKLSA